MVLIGLAWRLVLRYHRVGLSGDGQDAFPGPAPSVEHPWAGGHEFRDGQVDHFVVAHAGGESGESGHGPVDGVLGQHGAIVRVGGVGRDGAYHVGRVDVLNGGLFAPGREILFGLGLEKFADPG